MLTEKAIRRIAALMRRLHSVDVERFVEVSITHFAVPHVRADAVEIWRRVLSALQQTTLPPTGGVPRSPGRDGRFLG